MTVLAHEIKLVTAKEFDKLVWKRDIKFHFICYSPEDKGYVACFHQFSECDNYVSEEVFKTQWQAVEWIQGEENSKRRWE